MKYRKHEKYIERRFPLAIETMETNTAKNGIVRGYATVYDELIECYGEVVGHGAFKKSLEENSGVVPIFRSHDIYQEIGNGIEGQEDKIGLDVTGELLVNDIQGAREEWALMEQKHRLGKPRGISIGFSVIQEEQLDVYKGIQDVRLIKEAKLWEWSPTPFPANTKAGVTELRSDILKRIERMSFRDFNFVIKHFLDVNELQAATLFDNLIVEGHEAVVEDAEPEDFHSILEALQEITV